MPDDDYMDFSCYLFCLHNGKYLTNSLAQRWKPKTNFNLAVLLSLSLLPHNWDVPKGNFQQNLSKNNFNSE